MKFSERMRLVLAVMKDSSVQFTDSEFNRIIFLSDRIGDAAKVRDLALIEAYVREAESIVRLAEERSR